MRPLGWVALAASLLWCGAGAARAAGEYPLTLVASAEAKSGATTVTTMLTIRVNRLMNEGNRSRATDALKYGGYPKFLPALRALPAIGSVEFEKRKVEFRYSRETQEGTARRLVLVADRPLFFFSTDTAKNRAGYELTIVELTLDSQNTGTGRLLGAARVKPAPDDGVVVDDFATAPVQLTVGKASGK